MISLFNYSRRALKTSISKMDLEKVRPVLEKRTIVEGEATIEQIGNQVFYNKAQVLSYLNAILKHKFFRQRIEICLFAF